MGCSWIRDWTDVPRISRWIFNHWTSSEAPLTTIISSEPTVLICLLKMYESEKVKVLVAQSCLFLCNPMDCSLPGSSVHGILQVRILEWVAIPFSRGSSQPRDWTWISYIAGRFFTIWTTSEDPSKYGMPHEFACHSWPMQKKIIYHISLALSVDHREERGIWFCDGYKIWVGNYELGV